VTGEKKIYISHKGKRKLALGEPAMQRGQSQTVKVSPLLLREGQEKKRAMDSRGGPLQQWAIGVQNKMQPKRWKQNVVKRRKEG